MRMHSPGLKFIVSGTDAVSDGSIAPRAPTIIIPASPKHTTRKWTPSSTVRPAAFRAPLRLMGPDPLALAAAE
jgi:hypothetical protein